MEWQVKFPARVSKAVDKLPPTVRKRLYALALALRENGPVQPEMPHFGKLRGMGETYHCHIKSGKPTYVVVWRVEDARIQIIEVTYAGTHENAPY